MSKRLVQVAYDELIRETEQAALFLINDEEVWIPTSQIEDSSDEWILIPHWLADKKELEYVDP